MQSGSKKVLVITYYWPPSGGSGVQRWLKFVKYLPQFGWEPYVFTPQDPAYPVRDETLLRNVPDEAEVIHFPIWEPYDTFYRISGALGGKPAGKAVDRVGKKRGSFFSAVSTWIRGNLVVPDPKIFWVRPSVSFLGDFLKDNKISKIITTGPPHSIHLIGYRLKRKYPHLLWLADFRDPWSQWGLLDSLRVTRAVRIMHRRLEQQVLRLADIVTTITPFYVRQFEKLSGRKVEFLPNGFDEDDFRDIRLIRPDKFLIRHVGVVNERCDPRSFMNTVVALARENSEFSADVVVEFIGEVHADFRNWTKSGSAGQYTVFTPTIPHSALLQVYGSSSLLLLVLVGYKDAEGYMPGKLFEYLATGLPVMGVGPAKGDAAQLLAESDSGRMFEPQDTTAMKDYILDSYRKWKRGESGLAARRPPSKYSRRNVTEALTRLLEV